jgi:hypothetical protein
MMCLLLEFRCFSFRHFGTLDDEGSLSFHLPVTKILIFNILSDVPFRVFTFRHFGTPDVEGSLSLHLPVTEILIFNIPSDAPFRVFTFHHFGTPDVGVLDISNSRYPKSLQSKNSEMKFDQNFNHAIQSSLRWWSSLPTCLRSNEQAYLRILSSCQVSSASSCQKTSSARLTHPSCTQVIIAAVLSINDNHTLLVKHANSLCVMMHVLFIFLITLILFIV